MRYTLIAERRRHRAARPRRRRRRRARARNLLNGEPLPGKGEGDLRPGDGCGSRPRAAAATAECPIAQTALIWRFGRPRLECAVLGRGSRLDRVRRRHPPSHRLHRPSQGTTSNADRFQGMGCNGARSRRGRAAADPAQGRHPRGEQALRARARALLPLPDLRPPAEQPGPRVPPPRAAPRARGGCLARRGAAARGADPGRRHPAARPRPAALPGPRSPTTSRSPTRASSTSSRPYYVWTPDYAEKRLNWKRRHPLHILLLRVHRIPRPVTVRVRDEYHGCRSWVEIDRELPFEGTPVMADEEFDRARAEIHSALHRLPNPSWSKYGLSSLAPCPGSRRIRLASPRATTAATRPSPSARSTAWRNCGCGSRTASRRFPARSPSSSTPTRRCSPWPTPSCRRRAGRRRRPGAATSPAGRWRPSCTCSTTPTWNGAPPATTRARRCAAPPSASTRSW